MSKFTYYYREGVELERKADNDWRTFYQPRHTAISWVPYYHSVSHDGFTVIPDSAALLKGATVD